MPHKVENALIAAMVNTPGIPAEANEIHAAAVSRPVLNAMNADSHWLEVTPSVPMNEITPDSSALKYDIEAAVYLAILKN